MNVRLVSVAVLVMLGSSSLVTAEKSPAQTPARGTAPAPATTPAAKPAGAPSAGATRRVHASLNQVMRGVLFPSSNVIFSAQATDPATVKPDTDGSTSVNPLASLYGKWEAVENSGLALAEAANLLTIPGRKCSNGRLAPVQNADWARFVQELRATGMAAYKAAQSKDQDRILDVADRLTTTCANCHDVYREKTDTQGGLAARCRK